MIPHEKEPIPSIATIKDHLDKFESMIQLCKANGIKKFAYCDIITDSRLGCALVAILRQQYDVEYTSYGIFYEGDTVIPHLLLESYYDNDIVSQITDDLDNPIILQMYKDMSVKCPKWWLEY